MIYGAGSMLLALALLVAPVAPLAAAPVHVSHSGTVVAIDAGRGVLILDEVGPWRAGSGRTLTTRRRIVLTPDTKVNAFIRVNVPDGFAGDFLEVALDAGDLTPGDFVTVACVHAAGRLVATAVSLAE